MTQEPISLETPIGEDRDSHLSDFIEDHKATPSEVASHLLLKEQIDEVLANLTDRERKVLQLYAPPILWEHRSMIEISEIQSQKVSVEF